MLLTTLQSVTSNGLQNFVLEDVLRSLSGTALGSLASIDGGSTFQAIDNQRNSQHSCMTRRFPHFMGSTSGQTWYDIFEIDSQGNFGIGGKSLDPTLVSSTGQLLIGLFENQGYNFTWMNELTPVSPAQIVSQILFTANDSILVALLTGSTVQILCLNAADGSVSSHLLDSSSQLKSTGAAIVINQNYIYLAATTITNSLIAFAINVQAPFSIAGQIEIICPFNTYIVQSSNIIISSTNDLYIAGVCSSTPTCISLAYIQVSYAPGGIFSTFLSAQIREMSLAFQNPKLSNWVDQSLFMVSEGAVSSNYGIMLWRQDFSLSQEQGYAYSEGMPDKLQLLSIDSVNSNEIFVGYKNLVRSKIAILRVFFNSPAEVENYLLQKPLLSLSQVSFLKMKSPQAIYFCGSLSSLYSQQTGTCLSMGSVPVAFLATSSISESCFPFSFIVGSKVPQTLSLALIFNNVPTSFITSTLVLSNLNKQLSRINDANLYKTLNQCCNVKVTTSSMPYQKYIIEIPQQTYNHPQFSIVSNPCTDFTFYYKRDIAKMPASSTFIDTSAYIKFNDNPLNLSFQAYTSDPLLAGVYNVQLTGFLPNHQSQQGPVSIIEISSFDTITPSPISDLVYIFSSPAVNYKFNSFTQTAISGYSLFYQLEILTSSNNWTSNIDPSFLVFKQDLSMKVYTSSNSFIGTHQLRLKAKFTPNAVYSVNTQFKLTIAELSQKKIVIQPLKVPSMEISQSSTENSPLIVTYFQRSSDYKNGLSGRIHYSLTQVNGQPVPSFVLFQPQTLSFVIFQREEIKAGIYQFQLVEKIQRAPGEIIQQRLNFFNVTIKNELQPDVFPKQVIQQLPIREVKNLSDNQLTGKIVSINQTGAVTIKFSKSIMKVQNYSSIDQKVLSILVQKPEQDKRNVSIDRWKVTMMSQQIFKIQLYFNIHQDVSAADIMDTLEVHILDTLFFLSLSTNGSAIPIQNDFIMKKSIPRQIKPSHIIIITIAQYIGKTVVYSALVCSIISFIRQSLLLIQSIQLQSFEPIDRTSEYKPNLAQHLSNEYFFPSKRSNIF